MGIHNIVIGNDNLNESVLSMLQMGQKIFNLVVAIIIVQHSMRLQKLTKTEKIAVI